MKTGGGKQKVFDGSDPEDLAGAAEAYYAKATPRARRVFVGFSKALDNAIGKFNWLQHAAKDATKPYLKVQHLEAAKAKFAEIKQLYAEAGAPGLELARAEEVEAQLREMETEFRQAGHYALALVHPVPAYRVFH